MPTPDPVVVTTETLRGWPLPEPGSDKESRGRLLVLGGGDQTPGAALLAGEAALRAGGGKLQIATSRGVAGVVAVAAPEARVIPLPEGADGAIGTAAAEPFLEAAAAADVVLLGPGLMGVGAVVDLLVDVVPRLDAIVVLDALATAYVTERPDGLRHLADRCVITANPDELSRMLRRDEDEVTADPQKAAADLARRTGVVVLCGASDKSVATPEGEAWLVEAGGPGLG